MGHQKFVGVSLLLRERRSGLDAFGGIWNCPIERGPARSEAEGGNHQAGITEDRLRLIESLSFHSADEAVGIDIDVIERESSRVAEANAVLILRLVMLEAGRALFQDEPTGTGVGGGENGVSIGDAAVADPLLQPVDLIADDATVLHDALRRAFERSEIAARFRFGGTVGKQQALVGNAAQPKLLLLGSGTDKDRITAEERGQHGGRDAEIDARHFLADAIDIEGTTAEAAVLFGDEQELNAESIGIAHVVDDLQWAFVTGIQIDEFLVRQAFLGKVSEGFQTQFQCLFRDHGAPLFDLHGFTDFGG